MTHLTHLDGTPDAVEHVVHGGTVEGSYAEAMQICRRAKREYPATVRKIEDETWQVYRVEGGPQDVPLT